MSQVVKCYVTGDSMQILHSYCDNDSAPYKDAVLLLTTVLSGNTECQENTVEDALLRMLDARGVNHETATALLSRIATNVLCVQPEQRLTCQ